MIHSNEHALHAVSWCACRYLQRHARVARFRAVEATSGRSVFQGTVRIVPFLQAPGFCLVQTEDVFLVKFPDLSGSTHLQLLVRSAIAYNGFKVTFAANTLDPQFKSFKADFTVEPNNQVYHRHRHDREMTARFRRYPVCLGLLVPPRCLYSFIPHATRSLLVEFVFAAVANGDDSADQLLEQLVTRDG